MKRPVISHLSSLLQNKKISCCELTQLYLNAIRERNPSLCAYILLTEEQAMESARVVDQRLACGEVLAPLEGIPMSLKDNISTRDIETTCCSQMLKGYVPIYDASVWEHLKKSNAILLGKTNMDEFAMGSSGETSCFGGTWNPYDSSRVAGGSSSGAAASVAANLCAYALGSDTGGSVRQPAGFCGVVGLKPTYGTVSRYGLIAYASSFDQIGPIASSVEDISIIYDAISFHDSKDTTSHGACVPTRPSLKHPINGLKIGLVREFFHHLSPDIQAALEQAACVFRSLGAELFEFSVPELSYALPVYYILASAEASSNLGRYDGIRYGYHATGCSTVSEAICQTRSQGFGKEVKRRISLGSFALSSGYYDAYYKKAQALRQSISYRFRKIFDSCDLILAPTTPETAFPSGVSSQSPVVTYQSDFCTVPANLAGLPAISLPCGLDHQHLPIGMQLIADQFQEPLLLNAAWNYEYATEPISPIETGVIL